MTYSDILTAARTCSGPYCKVCPVCNGRACGSTMPGPGSKGSGTVATRNYDAWQRVCLNMDTICENRPADTRFTLFGETYSLPVFAGPVGAVKLHYGEKFTDQEYNALLVPACVQAGIAAFTGDGVDPGVFAAAAKAIGENAGRGIPTVKPWDRDTLFAKLDAAKASGARVFAMDIDAAGLPFLKGLTPPAGSKTVAELREIIDCAGVPFLIKGVMTVSGARKALEAGAAGIVVSNHGGRVQDGVPATAEVLPAIAQAVKGQMVILVDGGIRSGLDVFRALALGADACVLARPYVTAVYGGGAEGVQVLTEKLRGELADTMAMCGVHSLAEIGPDQIWH
ncbi:MAG: alpha-hydroxy-acid oxidizing protein [Lawsonibacter sp.]|nr:alpha-hydroxy-acid oxidizing protein [Lawsonibacter sp.]